MVPFWKKCYIVLLKHLHVRLYHFILTPLEILLPILLVVFAILLNSVAIKFLPFTAGNMHTEQMPPKDPLEGFEYHSVSSIIIIPDNWYTQRFTTYYKNLHLDRGEKPTITRLSKYDFDSGNYYEKPGIAFEFENEFESKSGTVPQILKYSLCVEDVDLLERLGVAIQHTIFLHFVNESKGDDFISQVEITTEKFPELPYLIDGFFIYQLAEFLFGFLIPLCFIFVVPVFITQVVMEKQSGMKELMRLMGLSASFQWFGFFVNAAAVMLFSVFIISILLTEVPIYLGSISINTNIPGEKQQEEAITAAAKRPILGKTAFFHVFAVFVLYVLSTIAFCLFLTTLFSKATKATLCGLLIWCLSIALPFVLLGRVSTVGGLEAYEMLLFSILPNMAFYFSLRLIALQERQNGLKWHHYSTSPTLAEDMCLLPLLAMLIVDIVLYWFLGWYLDQLFPGDYGVPRPWHFLCTDVSRCRRKSYSSRSEDEESSAESIEPPSRFQQILRRIYPARLLPEVSISRPSTISENNFEREPDDLQRTIRAVHLTKTFGRGCFSKTFVAVNDVSLNVYTGEIFILLGHNGAGKTVTMSMITGIYAPTKGSVTINGYDLRTDESKALDGAGFCPQDSMFFHELTVRQHLAFFGKLKGKFGRSLTTQINSLLQDLGLWDSRKTYTKKLSGGMQRRLQLAIAVVGNVRLLILDEPSSGLDPENRRVIWDMLLQLRKKCCIMLTTHHMEEADALGDRVAIMAHGKLICSGSPMFLRGMFGSDYIMKVTKAVGCDANEVLRFIRRYVPTARIDNETHTEISINLPVSHKRVFADLLRDLDGHLAQLNIGSFGLGTLGIEDVFLKVNEIAEDPNTRATAQDKSLATDENRLETSEGCRLCIQRFFGLMIKRVFYLRHRPLFFFSQFLLLFAFAILCIWLLNKKVSEDEEEPSQLSLVTVFDRPRLVVFESHNTDKLCLSIAYARNIPENVTLIAVEEKDLSATIVEVGKEDRFAYEFAHYVLGASFTAGKNGAVLANAMYYDKRLKNVKNDNAEEDIFRKIYSLNLIHNAVVQNCEKEQRTITVKVQTKRFTTIQSTTPGDSGSGTKHVSPSVFLRSMSFALLSAILFGIGLCVFTSFFVFLVVEERIKEFKHMQVMTGAGYIYVWAMAFFFDFLLYFIAIACCIVLFLSFCGDTVFGIQPVPGNSFLAMVIFGWSAIPFNYLISSGFKSPTVAFVVVICIQVFTVLIFGLPAFFLLDRLSAVIPLLKVIFKLFPGCAVTVALLTLWIYGAVANLAKHVIQSEARKPQGERESIKAALTKPDVDYVLLEMFLSGVLYILLILMLELRYSNVMYSCYGKGTVTEENEEPDVEAETRRIRRALQLKGRPSAGASRSSEESYDDALLVDNLSKKFWSKRVKAVRHLTFGVREDECFGLLGVNGAGKTTAFRMLTRSLLMSSGNAYLHDASLRKDPNEYLSQVGYCPQFHMLLDKLTCREILYVVANLRGIKGKVGYVVNEYLRQFGMTEYSDKITANLSLGTKRKLSAALAFIGSPNLVMLDEPTTGVDPGARRKIWNVVSSSKARGTSVILTSHSMDECEVLCTRLAIMVKGVFKCIGPVQHLKSKFGKGFKVSVKLPRETDEEKKAKNYDNVVNFMEKNFKDSTITGEHEGLIEYSVPYSSADWPKLFRLMEEAKTNFKLEDYSVSQATLEEIFLGFAAESESSVES